MGALFYWGSLVCMVACGGVSIYGVIVLVKNWKTADPDRRSLTIKGIAGLISTALVCFIVFNIVSIFYNPFPKTPSSNQEVGIKIEPKFDVNIRIQEGPNLTFTIKTNLPNETKLFLDIKDIEKDEVLGSREGEIMDGVIELGPFQNVATGKYMLYITIPEPIIQKESVRNIFGNNGENLTGNLVKDGSFNSKIIEVRVPFEVPAL